MSSLRERLDELYRRLANLPRADSAEGSLRQICQTLEQVEDELSGIVRRDPPPTFASLDGRMYCPQEDFILRRDNGSLVASTRGHRIEVATTGEYRIINKASGLTEFER